MSTSLRQRIIGLLLDLGDGLGTARSATLLDCPVCGRPLQIDIDRQRLHLRAACPDDPGHFLFEDDFCNLPEWIERYPQLNT
jgi:hypothetical protein